MLPIIPFNENHHQKFCQLTTKLGKFVTECYKPLKILPSTAVNCQDKILCSELKEETIQMQYGTTIKTALFCFFSSLLILLKYFYYWLYMETELNLALKNFNTRSILSIQFYLWKYEWM